MLLKRIFILLIVLSLAFACGSSITFPVAAVSDDGRGEVMHVTIAATEGNGTVFLGVPPYSGVDLQRSVVEAIGYAGDSNCSFQVSFGGDSDFNYMEGPSAGAAMASMTYLLAHNISAVNYPVITGAVDAEGHVLPVGGVYEKAMATGAYGIGNFISPRTNIYDYVMLKRLEEKGLHIIVADNITDVVNFVAYNITPAAPEYPVFKPEPVNLSAYENNALEVFRPISQKMIERQSYALQQLPQTGDEKWISDYFNASVNESGRLLSLGYVYTAANNAFLGYIDIATLAFVHGSGSSQDKAAEINNCIKDIGRPPMTTANFEWIVGADLRKAWAEDQMNSTQLKPAHLTEEEYVYFHEITFADAWCLAAKDFAAAAGNGKEGKPIDEQRLQQAAADYLAAANRTVHDEDTKQRFKIAQQLYDQGRYGASMFDSSYVMAMDLAAANFSSMSKEEQNATVQLLQKKRTSLWANVYASQAIFMAKKSEPDYKTAYSLLLLADNLDQAAATIKQAAEVPEAPVQPQNDLFELFSSFSTAIYLAIFILFVFLLIVTLPRFIQRRSHERQSNQVDRADRRAGVPRPKGRVPKRKK
ncbi:MAG: S16 family serine protease [Candidatus Micrarchaeota archaeon]